MGSTTTVQSNAASTTTVTRKSLSAEICVVTEIDAGPSAAWHVLEATERFGEWNPFITSLDGTLAAGGRITVVLALPERKPQTLRPKIIEFQEGRSLAWLGRIGVRGILDAEHHLVVEPVDDRHCRFVQRERFSGLLVPALSALLTIKTPAAFLRMNTALAERATNA